MSLVYHGGTLLSLTGTLMTGMMQLRLLTLFGSCCSIAYYFTRPQVVWGPIFWGAVFGVANLRMIVRLLIDRMQRPRLSAEDQRIYDRYFSRAGITLRQFQQLRKAAQQLEIPAGQLLRTQGESHSNLMLLISGQVAVLWGAQPQVRRVISDGWLGEMSFVDRFHDQRTGRHSVADLRTRRTSSVLRWPDEPLQDLLRKDAALQTAFLQALTETRYRRTVRRNANDEYGIKLRTALIDGKVSERTRAYIDSHRFRYNVSPWAHEWHLNQLGWTLEDWEHGSLRSSDAAASAELVTAALVGGPKAPRERVILFNVFSRDFSELAPGHLAPFQDDEGTEWASAEHYYQASRFLDAGDRLAILNTEDPVAAWRLGEQAAPERVRPDWDQVKEDVMMRAMRWKFRRHDHCRKALVQTFRHPLVYNDPGDPYWGCGSAGRGQNRVGRLLERLRAELQAQPD